MIARLVTATVHTVDLGRAIVLQGVKSLGVIPILDKYIYDNRPMSRRYFKTPASGLDAGFA